MAREGARLAAGDAAGAVMISAASLQADPP